MDVKEAVRTALQHLAASFDDEEVVDPALEEVKFDYDSDEWLITFGFERPWDPPRSNSLTEYEILKRRTFKVVRIDDKSGKVLSLTNRVLITFDS